MAPKEPQAEGSTKSAPSNLGLTELGEIGKRGAEAIAAAQTEFLDGFHGISQHWVVRAKSEADLGSELVARLASARSVPETVTAYQEWATRRTQMAIEDSQRILADSVKLMEASSRIISNGGGGRRA